MGTDARQPTLDKKLGETNMRQNMFFLSDARSPT